MYHLILCEKATGILLELDGKTRFLKTETNERPSLNFENIEDAENIANNLIIKNESLEIAIYDFNWSFIKTISKK